jgi:hypothetical protein
MVRKKPVTCSGILFECCDGMRSVDRFGEPIRFTFKGRTNTYNTTPGACLSLLMFLCWLFYVVLRIKAIVLAEEWTLDH